MELITTVLILLIYWLSFQPEWKLEMWWKKILGTIKVRPKDARDRLTLSQKLILAKFRQEISDWEHARKGVSDGG